MRAARRVREAVRRNGLAERPVPRSDRLLATCGVGRIPDAWREQLRPGGVIVANIGCGIARLSVTADHSASGRFLPELANFMTARSSPDTVGTAAGPLVQPLLTWSDQSREITIPVSLDAAMPQLLASLVQPGVNEFALADDDGRQMRCLFDPVTSSWARIAMTGVQTARLDHGGPRDLWAKREPLLSHWRDAGRPGHDRYGLSVSADGAHTLWLDEPEGASWRLPD